jgi:hypothetical protein
VELIAPATIWCLFGLFLVFPMLGLPAALQRAVATLIVAEFAALLLHSYGSAPLAAVGRQAASIDVPLLGVAVVLVAIMRGVSIHTQRR